MKNKPPAPHAHHMHAEIFEQPAVAQRILDTFIDRPGLALRFDPTLVAALAAAAPLAFAACGSSLRASEIASFAFEKHAGIWARLDIASELALRSPRGLDAASIQVSVSQSGTTSDTLQAMARWHAAGGKCVALVNDGNSTMARSADHVVLTQAGPELGIPSTKGFTAPLLVMFLLSVAVGRARNIVSLSDTQRMFDAAAALPGAMQTALLCEATVQRIARHLIDVPFVIYLGRNVGYPLALEGALKLQETACLPALGFAAAEFRHGPMALVRRGTPIVIVGGHGTTRDTIIDAATQARQLGAYVIGVGSDDDDGLADAVNDMLAVPSVDAWLAPLLLAIPLQLLAYHVALLRGADIDHPPNLVKSVRD